MKLLKFEASWCNTCKQQDKELAKIGIPVEHIDIDEDSSEALAGKYEIRSLPTMILLEEDKVIHKFTGLTKAEAIVNLVNSKNI